MKNLIIIFISILLVHCKCGPKNEIPQYDTTTAKNNMKRDSIKESNSNEGKGAN